MEKYETIKWSFMMCARARWPQYPPAGLNQTAKNWRRLTHEAPLVEFQRPVLRLPGAQFWSLQVCSNFKLPEQNLDQIMSSFFFSLLWDHFKVNYCKSTFFIILFAVFVSFFWSTVSAIKMYHCADWCWNKLDYIFFFLKKIKQAILVLLQYQQQQKSSSSEP